MGQLVDVVRSTISEEEGGVIHYFWSAMNLSPTTLLASPVLGEFSSNVARHFQFRRLGEEVNRAKYALAVASPAKTELFDQWRENLKWHFVALSLHANFVAAAHWAFGNIQDTMMVWDIYHLIGRLLFFH